MNSPNAQLESRSGRPRLIGWGATVVAFLLGYIFWIISREWWVPSLIVFGALFVAIFGLNCYLAKKNKAYDLYFAAALAILAPAIVIFVAFGFFFSGPPS